MIFQSSSEFKRTRLKMCSNCKLNFQSSSEFKSCYKSNHAILYKDFQSSSEFKGGRYLRITTNKETFNPLLSLRINFLAHVLTKLCFQSSSEFKRLKSKGDSSKAWNFQSSSEF